MEKIQCPCNEAASGQVPARVSSVHCRSQSAFRVDSDFVHSTVCEWRDTIAPLRATCALMYSLAMNSQSVDDSVEHPVVTVDVPFILPGIPWLGDMMK